MSDTPATAPAWEALVEDGVPRLEVRWGSGSLVAGVTTSALNFGPHTDAPAREVTEAQRRFRAWAADRFEGLVGASQMHGARLFRADGLSIPERGPRSGPYALRLSSYDGFLSRTPGILLTIGVADCVPVILHAPGAGAVALLHAGWRGVAGGILSAGLAAMEREYGVASPDVEAWWGPAIGPCCFAVGEEVVTAIRATAAGPSTEAWARREGGGLRVDLRAALTTQAQAAGVPVAGIASSSACTACDPTYHSYRRARGGGGRMLAFAGRPREAGRPR